MGRDAELARIESWIAAAASDVPTRVASVLVIEGEPGIGKTTLWAETVRRCAGAGWQEATCRPSASDASLPYVALADLLRAIPPPAFERLPRPQRQPLEVALLRVDAGEGDLNPRAVRTGLAALLAVVAEGAPLLLGVDDAQWLDAASAAALAFALRRMDDRPVRFAAAVRTGDPSVPRGGAFGIVERDLGASSIERLTVGPLTVAAIHRMLQHELAASIPRPTLVRIHRAAGGNPFYALEIGREILLKGAPGPGEPFPVPADHRDLALLRLRRLPRATRDALLQAAALSRATVRDVDADALAAAERAGIVRVGQEGRVEFTHPLFGSSLYSSVSDAERRRLHRALADRAGSVEERARHLALATEFADEETARLLDEAAAAASSRGAAEVAVELKELARRLTPTEDREAVVRRDLELADRRYFAGDAAGARRGLERSLASLEPGEERAQVLLELGSVLWTQGELDAGLAMLSQAREEASSTKLLARIHSRTSAFAADADLGLEHARAALALVDERDDPLLFSFALHNMAMWKLYAGGGADHDAVEQGMALQRNVAAWEVSTVPAYWARMFDDFETARRRFEDLLRGFREQGDEASSCGVLAQLAMIEAMTGHIDRGRKLAADALDLAEQTGQDAYVLVALHAAGQVAVRAGDLEAAISSAGEILRRLEAQPDPWLEAMARAVLGMAAFAGGDPLEADRQLSRADDILESQHMREPAGDRFHPDHVEAVIELGELDRAERLVERLERRAEAVRRPWIAAVSARSSGLLKAARGDLDGALDDFVRALDAHRDLVMPLERGRTLLALGRLHRRRNERQLAQRRLEEALGEFEAGGALGWAAVAGSELQRARARRGSGGELTATERRIAELAASGLRNQEIAARLFLSGKTVEANLTRVYRKLGIRSRAELGRRLSEPAGR